MLKKEIKQLIKSLVKESFGLTEIDLTVNEEERFGDYSSNVLMILAKKLGQSPWDLGTKFIPMFLESELIESASVAGSGFMNLKIKPACFVRQIIAINQAQDQYGAADLGRGHNLNLEFISANPTGPLTVGNSRGGVIGDVLTNILTKVGYRVTREYYFNDAGGQIDILGHSVLKDSLAQYRGDYIDELSREITGVEAAEAGRLAARKLIGQIKESAKNMGIKFDVWTAEGKDLRQTGKVNEVIEYLKSKGLTREKDGALWFLSTQFGDDKDRVLLRSNGEPTYFAVDCAYHRDKFVTRCFDRAIDIWGADHHGDMARVKGFVKALGFEDKFTIIIHQFVRVVKDGKEVRMSKRTGNYIAVDDLLKEVGKDVYRFFMLTYSPDSHLNFDLNLAKEQSEKNPVYYVQYAYARIQSILAKSEILNSKFETNSNHQIPILKQPEEINLAKQLIKLPELVEEISRDYQVQKLPQYALSLSRAFHHFYEKCPVIAAESPEIFAGRIQLLKAAQIVLKNTLDLMGISAPEKM